MILMTYYITYSKYDICMIPMYCMSETNLIFNAIITSIVINRMKITRPYIGACHRFLDSTKIMVEVINLRPIF